MTRKRKKVAGKPTIRKNLRVRKERREDAGYNDYKKIERVSPVKVRVNNLENLNRVLSRKLQHFEEFKPQPVVLHDNTVKMVCKAREERRRVIFAKGKQGGSHKKPFFSLSSYIRCK